MTVVTICYVSKFKFPIHNTKIKNNVQRVQNIMYWVPMKIIVNKYTKQILKTIFEQHIKRLRSYCHWTSIMKFQNFKLVLHTNMTESLNCK